MPFDPIREERITATGRGLRRPLLSVQPGPGPRRVTVRVDSEADPAYWLDLVLDDLALEHLLDLARRSGRCD